jgi:hypothetical protein
VHGKNFLVSCWTFGPALTEQASGGRIHCGSLLLKFVAKTLKNYGKGRLHMKLPAVKTVVPISNAALITLHPRGWPCQVIDGIEKNMKLELFTRNRAHDAVELRQHEQFEYLVRIGIHSGTTKSNCSRKGSCILQVALFGLDSSARRESG